METIIMGIYTASGKENGNYFLWAAWYKLNDPEFEGLGPEVCAIGAQACAQDTRLLTCSYGTF